LHCSSGGGARGIVAAAAAAACRERQEAIHDAPKNNDAGDINMMRSLGPGHTLPSTINLGERKLNATSFGTHVPFSKRHEELVAAACDIIYGMGERERMLLLDHVGIYVRWTARSCNRFKLDLNYGFVSSCTYLMPFMYIYVCIKCEREGAISWVGEQ
jgi:hypothetical protein